jgi:hypothetical protein
MSGDLDVASGMADFRLIDPPRVAPQPVSPNRALLLPLVLLISLAAGVFASLAASQLRPVFFSTAELRAKLDLPILGIVSAVMSDADVRRRRMDIVRFGAASGGLIAAFAAGLTTLLILANR